jgi:5-hydroxyisourate hydrolase-like protein (transthyretin family)
MVAMVTRCLIIPAAMLFVTTIFQGCFPTRVHETPEIQGRVFDFITGAPVRNVTVTALSISPHKVDLVSHTDADGRFNLAETSSKAWLPVGFDLAYANITIRFDAEGYVSQRIEIPPFQKWDGDVRIHPADRHAPRN